MLGKIVTFYSYKGGTGRSMALANFAWILAASGKRVLTIDWDLEAPGLHRYFRPFLIDSSLTETDGLIDVFWRSAASAMGQIDGTLLGSPQPSGPVQEDTFGEALENSAVRLDHTFPSKGFIDFIAAGRQTPTYSQRVNTFVWWRFYDIGGSKLLQEARQYLASQYDWVLIDSRTGVSDTAGISTIQLPDMVVACFTLNRQSIDGVSNVLKSIRDFRSDSVDGSRKAFFPIATRIENAEQHRLEMARIYARSMLADFLPEGDSSRDYWDDMEVAYRPAYAFEEVLAAYGDATGAAGAADTMLTQMEIIAQRITGEESLRMPEIIDEDRKSVLARYALGTAPAGSTESSDISPTPQPTPSSPTISRAPPSLSPHEDSNEFLRGVVEKEQVWRSSGFAWRHLLSQRELDMLTEGDRKSFGRTVTYYVLQSERAVMFFNASNRNFLINILFGLASGVGYYAFAYITDKNSFGYVPNFQTVIAFWFGAFTWLTVAIVGGALQRSSKNTPYGLLTRNAVVLSLLGPFRPVIQDYVRPKY